MVRMVLRFAGTSRRNSEATVTPRPAASVTIIASGSLSANSVGRYDHGMSGTETISPLNSSFHGFSKKAEKYVIACSGLSSLTIDHGQISPITR